MRTPEPLFARATSGLVRAFGAWDVFTFNVLGYALGLVLALTPTFLEQQAVGVTIQFVLLVGITASLINGLTYASLSAIMPRSGGDYVFVSRTLGMGTGFVASWGFTCSQVFGLGVYLYWCITTVISPGMLLVGDAMQSGRWIAIAKTLSGSSSLTLGVGIALFLAVGAVSMLGMRAIKIILNTLFILAITGIGVLTYALFTHEQRGAIDLFAAFVERTGGNAESLLPVAQSAGPGMHTSALVKIFQVLPLGYWVFLGFTYSVYIGGEVRQAQKSQLLGIIGSIIFGFFVYWVVLTRYYYLFGANFVRTISELAAPEVLPAGNTLLAVGGSLAGGVAARLSIAFSFFLWYFLLLIVMTQICVRNLFAWSMDRLAPQVITTVTPRHSAPSVATFVVCVSGLAVFLLHWWKQTAFVNYIALFSVCNLFTGLAAMVLPYARTDLLRRSIYIFQYRLFSVPLISVLGAANTGLFALILIAALTRPTFSGVAPGWQPTAVLALTYGAGLAVFTIYKRRGNLHTKVLSLTLPPD